MTTSLGQEYESTGRISLAKSDLPEVAESFVRGDEWHLSLPQSEGFHAGLEFALMVTHSDCDCLIVESTLSLQTLWLDAYPEVQLQLPGDGLLSCVTKRSAQVFSNIAGSASDTPQLSSYVLIDKRDQLSLLPLNESRNRIQLFGEFMEKGVIRKVQPWWVWTRQPLAEQQVNHLADNLSKRPLPLTP